MGPSINDVRKKSINPPLPPPPPLSALVQKVIPPSPDVRSFYLTTPPQ